MKEKEVPELKVIARIHSDFSGKFGIPRQSGLVEELESAVVFEPEYRREDALLETLDQRQLQLLEDYQESEWDCTEQRERAVFLAAFQLARALR